MRVVHRDIKYPRIELRTGFLTFILPRGDNHERLVKKYHRWIHAKQELIQDALHESRSKRLVRRSLPELRRLAKALMTKHTRSLGVSPRGVVFIEMSSKWGSCSPNGRLTLNTLMRFLPKRLIDYIIFHELYHLVERRHNTEFWDGIGNSYKRYRSLEKDLFSYWFAIQKMNDNGREKQWKS